MPLLAKVDDTQCEKVINKYINSQFKLMRKNKKGINDTELFHQFIHSLETVYSIAILNDYTFSIKMQNNDIELYKLKEFIACKMKDYYGDLNINMIFKFVSTNEGFNIHRKKII